LDFVADFWFPQRASESELCASPRAFEAGNELLNCATNFGFVATNAGASPRLLGSRRELLHVPAKFSSATMF
jgi:hypothetical protein